MNMQAHDGIRALTDSLTDREKQTLRMMVRGHDAKSIARSLDLSVHTINERLRDARRKMAVSSSREAARLLLAAEGGDAALSSPQIPGDLQIPEDPENIGDSEIGADESSHQGDQDSAPDGGAGRLARLFPIISGAVFMSIILGLLALATAPQQASTIPDAQNPSVQQAANGEVVGAAQRFLTLLDADNWDASYQMMGAAFHKLNTQAVWAGASDRMRAQMGAMVSRSFVSQEELPAPPMGYEVVKFRTDFANKAGATETVTLERQDGGWRVVGVMVE